MHNEDSNLPKAFKSVLAEWWGDEAQVEGWNMDTEVLYDLHLTDDDLDELLIVLQREFNVEIEINYRNHLPSWVSIFSGNGILDRIYKRITGREPYSSLTLGMLWNRIEKQRTRNHR